MRRITFTDTLPDNAAARQILTESVEQVIEHEQGQLVLKPEVVQARADRVQRELKTLRELGLCQSFLITTLLDSAARKKVGQLGPARGALGSSVVATLLGVGNSASADPVASDYRFENFFGGSGPFRPTINVRLGSTDKVVGEWRRKLDGRVLDELYHVCEVFVADAPSPRDLLIGAAKLWSVSRSRTGLAPLLFVCPTTRKNGQTLARAAADYADSAGALPPELEGLLEQALLEELAYRPGSLYRSFVVTEREPAQVFPQEWVTRLDSGFVELHMPVEAFARSSMFDIAESKAHSLVSSAIRLINRGRPANGRMKASSIALDDDTYRLIASGQLAGQLDVFWPSLGPATRSYEPRDMRGLADAVFLAGFGAFVPTKLNEAVKGLWLAREAAPKHLRKFLDFNKGKYLTQSAIIAAVRRSGVPPARAFAYRALAGCSPAEQRSLLGEFVRTVGQVHGLPTSAGLECFDILAHASEEALAFGACATADSCALSMYRAAYLSVHHLEAFAAAAKEVRERDTHGLRVQA